MPFIVVLSTQIWNIKTRSSKLTTNCSAHKIMANYGFESKFYDLEYLLFGIFPYIFLEFTINLREISSKTM